MLRNKQAAYQQQHGEEGTTLVMPHDASPSSSQTTMASEPTNDSTVIQLEDLAGSAPLGDDGVALMTGDASGVRSRGDGSSKKTPQLSPPQKRKRIDDSDFDPIQEFLDILPPPLARALVYAGKRLNPSGMQIVNLRKDLLDNTTSKGSGDSGGSTGDAGGDGGDKVDTTIYNSNKAHHVGRALIVGLKPYGIALAVATLVYLITTLVSPSYFIYPYMHFEFSGIFSSWLLLLWGVGFSAAVWHFRGRDVRTRGRPYLLKAANGLIFALVEELGFRYVFICLAMVVAGLFNVVIENAGLYVGIIMTLAGTIVVVISLLYLAGVLKKNEHVRRVMKRYNPVHVLVGSGIVVVTGAFVLVLSLVWGALFAIVWDWIVFPVVNFLTLYQYDQLFMGAFGMNVNSYEGLWVGSRRRRKIWQQNASDNNRMFMVGLLLANVFYRDGKKFQGVLGLINSLYVGLALANSMLSHGLFTALAVHLIYEAQYYIVGHLMNKYAKARRPRNDLSRQ